MPLPRLLAMLSIQPPLAGDEALLRLAQARLGEAGLGGELYPGSPEHLQRLLAYRPFGLACTAHLPRDIDLLRETHRGRLMDYVQAAAGTLYGLVLHDQAAFARHPDHSLHALRETDRLVSRIPDAPLIFVEYAAGLEPDFFAGLFEQCSNLQQVSAAIDVGHVGIHVCQSALGAEYPLEALSPLRPHSPRVAARIDAIQRAVRRTLPTVIALIQRLAQLDKPLHFHLHDGHPLSTLSRFGVSDHLSFLQQIRLPFDYRGRRLLPGMFGVNGLHAIIQAAMQGACSDQLSFMLEIHPMEGRIPLGEHLQLFSHWADKTNAERMNYWLGMLLENATLARAAWGE